MSVTRFDMRELTSEIKGMLSSFSFVYLWLPKNSFRGVTRKCAE